MIHRYLATVGDRDVEVTIEPLEPSGPADPPGQYRVSIEGRVRVVDARKLEGTAWSLATVGGGPCRVVDVDGRAPDLVVTADNRSVVIKLNDGRRAAVAGVATRRAATGPQPLRAPMPGKVVKLLVKSGDEVKAGQGVIVIEAMKMENELKAPRDGKVGEVGVVEGQAVEAGQTLALIG